MRFRNDKVTDVVAVLSIIREKYRKRYGYCNATELRKESIIDLAEFELRSGRYKNERSAIETIRDACTRRLKPNITGIRNFDRLVDEWLHGDSSTFKAILLKNSKRSSQQAEVSRFFEGVKQ
jgi:hypothetical protein